MGNAAESGGEDRSSKQAHAEHSPGIWPRVKDHKVIQWGVAYLGAALALAQATDLMGAAFEWPTSFARAVVIALAAGLPIALTLAWYHGHRGLKNISQGELAIVAALLLLGGLWFATTARPDADASARAANSPIPAAADTAASAPEPERPRLQNSVAILPFENLSPDPGDAFFAPGLNEELHLTLGKLKNLNPISRTTMARYAGSALTIPEIGRELNVESILAGTVRYAGERVRISITLIDAVLDRPIWSEIYDRELEDIFEVQADIAMNIANRLAAPFTTLEQRLLERPPTVSIEAFTLYLQAGAAPDWATTERRLNEAIAADPTFATPYGLLAYNYAFDLINTDVTNAVSIGERAELERRVHEYAQKALSLDSAAPFANAALAVPAMLSWRWTEALAAYDRALERAPTDILAQHLWLLAYAGKRSEVTPLLERFLALNPNEVFAALTPGLLLGYWGEYDRAADVIEDVLERDPTNLLARDWAALMHVARGDTSAALTQLEYSERLAPDTALVAFLAEWAYAYGRLGRDEDARRLAARIQAASEAGVSPGAGGWAMAYLAIGDRRRALEQLEQAAEKVARHEPDEGFFALMALRMNVANDPLLREDRAFVEVLSRIRGD